MFCKNLKCVNFHTLFFFLFDPFPNVVKGMSLEGVVNKEGT